MNKNEQEKQMLIFLNKTIKSIEENKKNANSLNVKAFWATNLSIATLILSTMLGWVDKKDRINLINELVDRVNATIFTIENELKNER